MLFGYIFVQYYANSSTISIQRTYYNWVHLPIYYFVVGQMYAYTGTTGGKISNVLDY